REARARATARAAGDPTQDGQYQDGTRETLERRTPTRHRDRRLRSAIAPWHCAPTFTSRRNTPPDALARDSLPVADLLARGSPLPAAFPGTSRSQWQEWPKTRRLQLRGQPRH